ncbi:MAG: ATP-binding cassette domain-containing protein [Cytophagaceae bacterium]|nr:ATP-binding cassette domain-containing protein [Cytophagaceae bacterium]MDW8456622.1 ATP-binding cassette domain-containing protein [Cytophagaceae bacterium]
MIELENICVQLKNFCLQNISLKIEKEKFHVLFGVSGSGKTLLLETIAGLQSPTKGKIYLNGKDSTNLPPEQRCISYVSQDNTLFPHLNVYDNICFAASMRSALTKEKTDELIRHLNISDLLHRYPQGLSGGEIQRVSIARALVAGCSVVLLDEPTSSLHETFQEDFCCLLKNIQSQQKLTIIMTTHDRNLAIMLADWFHFIESGRVTFSTKVSEFYINPLPVSLAELLGISNILTVQRRTFEEETKFFCKQLNQCVSLKLSADVEYEDVLPIGINPSDIHINPSSREAYEVHFRAIVSDIFFTTQHVKLTLIVCQTNCILKAEIKKTTVENLMLKVGDEVSCLVYSRDIILLKQ